MEILSAVVLFAIPVALIGWVVRVEFQGTPIMSNFWHYVRIVVFGIFVVPPYLAWIGVMWAIGAVRHRRLWS